jgi:selenocysteine lyase/cysteine desulfurase
MRSFDPLVSKLNRGHTNLVSRKAPMRVSVSVFNDDDDIDQLVDVLG